MSVYKSRRKDAAAQFIADARELRKYTVRVTRKFPKSYRDITNGLTELAREIYLNSMKATKTEAGWIYRRHGSVREEEAAA